ncbi:hypothetical protein ABW03_20720 [Bacillus altitudinis]|nr:hypothetical protein ABW03_20720 [Bacillus altitudinis]
MKEIKNRASFCSFERLTHIYEKSIINFKKNHVFSKKNKAGEKPASGCRENLDSFIFFLKIYISSFYNREKPTKGRCFSHVPH